MALNKRYPLIMGACSIALITGCASTTDLVALDKSNVKVQPVYRVQQPAGTAAGQYAVGRIDLAEGRVDAAIVRFRNSLKLDPAFVEAHNGLGVAFGMKGRYEEAAEAFTAALAHGPASAHVLNNLGYAQMKAGRLHEAWRSFGQSLDLDPKNASTRENVRLLALQRGDGATSTADASVTKARGDVPRIAVREEARMQPNQPEIVLSASDASALVQLSTNVYELRPLRSQATAPASRPVSQPVATVAAPASMPEPVTTTAAMPLPSRSVEAASPSASKPAARRWVSRFEVSNGAGIERLAARTATQLARSGIGISRVSNYERFDRAMTEIHYRKGFLEDARVVQKNLPVPAKLVASRSLRPDVNVRLVLGRDMVQARIAGWYDGDDVHAVVSVSTDDSGPVAQASTPRVEKVASRGMTGGWRYL